MGQIENDEESIELPCQIYQETLKEIIKNNLKSPFEECKVVIDAGSAKGDNYLGIVYRANIKDPKGKELNVIIKLPPTSVARREQFFARTCFIRESEFYDRIYPMFRKFQEERGIDVEKFGFHQVAGCYKTLTEDLSEGLFLEDLKVSGFEMFDRFKDVTADHVFRVMESLGQLHALSFAIKDQNPELIAPFKKIKDFFLQGDDAYKKQTNSWYTSLKKQAADTLNDHPNQDLRKTVDKVLEEEFYEILEPVVHGASAEPHAVICHGDCWNNNIMYRYENGIPVDIRLLDWQIIRYASPVCDLLYYIFACTTKDLREKYYKDFLDVYYKSLSSFLTRLGSNPLKIYPREILDDHLKRFGKFGIVMAIMILPIITSKPEDALDMDLFAVKMKEAQDSGTAFDADSINSAIAQANEGFTVRMREVFEDMYDLQYI